MSIATNKIKEYEYTLTKGEIKYAIFMNPDKEKYKEISERIRENSNRCVSLTDRPFCMCKDFLSRDSEGLCNCERYFKKQRTEYEVKRYLTDKKVFSKNEKKILSEKEESEDSENFMATNVDEEN